MAETTLNMKLLLRRAEFVDTCVLSLGEPGYHTATKELKIGDGTTQWSNLPIANKTQIDALISAAISAHAAGYYTKGEVDGFIATINAAIDTKLDKDTYNAYIAGRQLTDTAIEEAVAGAKTHAETKISEFNTSVVAPIAKDVEDLEKYVGTFTSDTATTVVGYINEKTAGIATDANLKILEDRLAEVEENYVDSETYGSNLVTIDESIENITKTGGAIDTAITALDEKLTNAALSMESSITGNMDALKNDLEAADKALEDAYKAADSEVLTQATNEAISRADTAEANAKADAAAKYETKGTAQGIVDALKLSETYEPIGAENRAVATAAADATSKANTAEANAKAYSDENDIFHTDILTVNALGGVSAGADLDGMTVREVLNTLLYPYVSFTMGSTSRSAAAATLENGASQTLSSASITVTKKSKPITSIQLLNGSTVLEEKTGDAVAAGGTITFNGFTPITVTKSNNPNLKFTVTDGQTTESKNVGASTFVYPYYWGVCAADATIDEDLVEGLTKKVETKANKTVTYTYANERMVFAYPKVSGYTTLKSILDPNNFEIIDGFTCHEVSITGLDGTAVTYYVYVSTAGTATNFKIQFKY